MKKLMLLLLIAFLSCSDSKNEPIEPEPICYAVYGVSTGNGSNFVCDSRLLLILIEKSKWDAETWTRNDRIEICVTNPAYKFNDFRLGEIFCDLEDFTN